MNFADNFKATRKNAGLSQQQVADILNMERSSIAKYENGTSTSNNKNLTEICELLNVSVIDLLK